MQAISDAEWPVLLSWRKEQVRKRAWKIHKRQLYQTGACGKALLNQPDAAVQSASGANRLKRVDVTKH